MWNTQRYLDVKRECQIEIDNKTKTPYDYMFTYKQMIKEEDYEAAKAITEVLNLLNYDTANTHNYIPELNK